MKNLLLGVCAGLCWMAQAAEVQPYAEALKTGKPVLVLCVGQGWMPRYEAVVAAYQEAAKAYDGEMQIALYDRPAGLSQEEINALGKLPCEFFGYPCLIIRDAEGRPVFQREGVPVSTVKKAAAYAKKYEKLCAARDAALKAAREMPVGLPKAEALGQALSPILDPVIATYSERAIAAYQNSVRGIVNEIKKADPNDTDGWAMKYTFCYMPIQEGTINKKPYDENEKMIQDYLNKKALLPIQRQMVYAMRFKNELLRAGGEGDLTPAIKALDDGIALAPKTTIAEAMRNMKNYYQSPVKLSGMKWSGRDNRPRWHKAILNCSSQVKESGQYRVTFEKKAGNTSFRKVRFMGCADGKDLGRGAWSCNFTGEGKPILEMELRGHGWFEGRGEIHIQKE